jgi:hypothetical protein
MTTKAISFLGARYADRAEYAKVVGIQAPPFDTSRAKQYWHIPSYPGNAGDLVTLSYPDTTDPERPQVKTMQMRVRDIWNPNIPGTYDYPRYTIAPTDAATSFEGQLPSPLNPMLLSYETQATALLSTWAKNLKNLKLRQLQGPGQGGFTYDFHLEARRVWVIVEDEVLSPGSDFIVNVGVAIASRNRMGIGSPGHWNFSETVPAWINDMKETDNHSHPIPRPMAPLAKGETLIPNGPFSAPIILLPAA